MESERARVFLPETAPQTCWAAVSFLFEDAAWCDWIYQEFDGMRVPRPLSGQPSRHGVPYPPRLAVSPDPADPEQLENHVQTLQTAQHLIVVISPACAKETVIQDHLRLFRQAGGEERIIALVVKGEPGSASAEPGREDDREWLPAWLKWRFKHNTFEPAPLSEPIVVDARLGVSSLAEVRAQLCASLLEVPASQLAELGVVIRSSPAAYRLPSSKIVPMPEPTPLPTLAKLAAPKEIPAPRHALWPLVLCGLAVLASLGCLVLLPTREPRPSTPLVVRTARENTSPLPANAPLVAVVPMTAKIPALPETSVPAVEEAPKPLAEIVPAVPQSTLLPVQSSPPLMVVEALAAPSPRVVPVLVGTSGMVTARGEAARPLAEASSLPPAPAVEDPERKRAELTVVRDRLTRLAETRANAGEAEEALATLQQAVEIAHELVNRTNGAPGEVVELGQLYRRFGQMASRLNSAAEGRVYYDQGKKVLQGLRAKGKLPREAVKILNELDTASRTRNRD